MKSIYKVFVAAIVLFSNSIYGQTRDRLPQVNKVFSIVVHVVKDSAGTNGMFGTTPDNAIAPQVQISVDSLNAHFAPIGVSFNVCEIRFIENYWYLNISTSLNQANEMFALYNAKNRINLYYVENINVSDTYFYKNSISSGISNGGLILSSNSIKNTVHGFGHLFGLMDTDAGGNELVDGSNASTAGDMITDTPADYPFNPVNMSDFISGCTYISEVKDINDDYYMPLVGNAMSSYSSFCLCQSGFAFTQEQYKKMVSTYLQNPDAW